MLLSRNEQIDVALLKHTVAKACQAEGAEDAIVRDERQAAESRSPATLPVDEHLVPSSMYCETTPAAGW